MSLVIEQTDRVPLAEDASSVIHVEGTRVTLDPVAEAFHDGATAEEMIQQYPSLSLADVNSILGCVLRHPTEVAAYMETRTTQRNAIRRQNEGRFTPKACAPVSSPAPRNPAEAANGRVPTGTALGSRCRVP